MGTAITLHQYTLTILAGGANDPRERSRAAPGRAPRTVLRKRLSLRTIAAARRHPWRRWPPIQVRNWIRLDLLTASVGTSLTPGYIPTKGFCRIKQFLDLKRVDLIEVNLPKFA